MFLGELEMMNSPNIQTSSLSLVKPLYIAQLPRHIHEGHVLMRLVDVTRKPDLIRVMVTRMGVKHCLRGS